MAARDACRWACADDACAELVPPAERCISGGDVMTAFFSVLFGGLNFAQALPGLAALAQRRTLRSLDLTQPFVCSTECLRALQEIYCEYLNEAVAAGECTR